MSNNIYGIAGGYDVMPQYGVAQCSIQPMHECTSTSGHWSIGEGQVPNHEHTINSSRKWCVVHRCEIMPNDFSGQCQLASLEQRVSDAYNRIIYIERRLADALQVVQVMEKLDGAYEKSSDGSVPTVTGYNILGKQIP